MSTPTDTTKARGPVPMRSANGGQAQIPALGLGTWELKGADCVRSVREAAVIGYRHFDTARAYDNEGDVGKGLRESGLGRQEFWLTSKAWYDDLSPAGVRTQAETSLRELGVDYLDLYLLHWPNDAFDLAESLDELTRLVDEQKIRSFGVSNFTAGQWRDALGIAPAIVTNQVEYHPFLGQDDLLEVAAAHEALVTAYSPLGSGAVHQPEKLGGEALHDVAQSHGKSPAQVALRWLLDQPDVVAIPRSSSRDHLRANFEIFDFELTADDREAIAALPKDKRQIHPQWAPAAWGPPPKK